MTPPNITTALDEEDGPVLASIMTLAFSNSDAAYPLTWGGTPKGTHDALALKGLFTPLKKEGQVIGKAMDGDKLVGFALWSMPKPKTEEIAEKNEREKKDSLPEIPGANMQLWREKMHGLRKFHDRDVEPSKDMLLSLFFVHPDYQRQGIGSSLLQWGLKKADETGAKLWLTSTPQAVSTYERNGWRVLERQEIDLGLYGGEGTYTRAWMVREPKAIP